MKSLKVDMIIEGEQLGILMKIPVDKNYHDEVEYKEYVFLQNEGRFRKLQEVVRRSKLIIQDFDNNLFEEMEEEKYLELEKTFVEMYYLDLEIFLKDRAIKRLLTEKEKEEVCQLKEKLEEKKKEVMTLFVKITNIFN